MIQALIDQVAEQGAKLRVRETGDRSGEKQRDVGSISKTLVRPTKLLSPALAEQLAETIRSAVTYANGTTVGSVMASPPREPFCAVPCRSPFAWSRTGRIPSWERKLALHSSTPRHTVCSARCWCVFLSSTRKTLKHPSRCTNTASCSRADVCISTPSASIGELLKPWLTLHPCMARLLGFQIRHASVQFSASGMIRCCRSPS